MHINWMILTAALAIFTFGCDEDDGDDGDSNSETGDGDGDEIGAPTDTLSTCIAVCEAHEEACPEDVVEGETCDSTCDEIVSVSEVAGCENQTAALFECADGEPAPECGEDLDACDADLAALEACLDAYDPSDPPTPAEPLTQCVELCEARLEMCPDDAEPDEDCDSECGALEAAAITTGCEDEAVALFECAGEQTPAECGETVSGCDEESDALGDCINAYSP